MCYEASCNVSCDLIYVEGQYAQEDLGGGAAASRLFRGTTTRVWESRGGEVCLQWFMFKVDGLELHVHGLGVSAKGSRWVELG